MHDTDAYIQTVRVQNMGPIKGLKWHLDRRPQGWHVIIGDNGSGKSTLLRAIAVALIGKSAALSLRIPTERMARRHASFGSVSLTMCDASKHTWRTDKQGGKSAPRFHAGFGPTRRFGGENSPKTLEATDLAASRHVSLFDSEWSLTDVVGWLKNLKIDEIEGQDGGGPTQLDQDLPKSTRPAARWSALRAREQRGPAFS